MLSFWKCGEMKREEQHLEVVVDAFQPARKHVLLVVRASYWSFTTEVQLKDNLL